MTNSIRSPSEILEIVVSLVKSPGDSNVQPGLRNTRLMETIMPTKGNKCKEFPELFENQIYCFKTTSILSCFSKEGKVIHKTTVVALTLKQILDPERKHTVCGRLQQDLSGIRYQVAQTPNGITWLGR